MPTKTKRTLPKRVSWTTHEELRCALLAGMGFSTQFICEETGLTPCQVSYRLHKGLIKRADYRNGKSEMAELALSRTERVLGDQDIRAVLNLKVIK